MENNNVDPQNPTTTGRGYITPTAAVAMLDATTFSSVNANDAIPAAWDARAKKAWSYYLEEPIVKNAINAWRTFAIGEAIRVHSENARLKSEMEAVADRLNLTAWVKDMVLQLLVKGEAVGFRPPDLSELLVINPLSVTVAYERSRLTKVEQHPENIGDGDVINLPLDHTLHLKWDAPAFSPRGNSMVLPAFQSIELLRDYRRAEQAIAKRWATPLRLIKVGGSFGPKVIMPDQSMLETVRDMINKMDMKSGLVVPYYVSVETHGTESSVLNTEEKVRETKEDIMIALGLTKSLVSGDGPNFATASISLQKMLIMIQEIKQAAKVMLRWVFDDWLKAHGHETKSLQFLFNDLDPTDALDYKRILLELFDRNLISRQTLQLKLDLDPELERGNQEKESDQVSISDNREVQNLLAAVAAGIVQPETVRKVLRLKEQVAPERSSEAYQTLARAHRVCDQCAHFDPDHNHCRIHESERAFDDTACRFFQGRFVGARS